MSDKTVTLTHPDRSGSIKVSASHADMYVSQGWAEKAASAKAAAPKAPAAKTTTPNNK